jgi:Protein kinase domain
LCRAWLARTKRLSFSDGSWFYSRERRRDDPAQGWKIHVSATILSAHEVFGCIYPILRKSEVLFKVPCRLELLIFLNSGIPNFSQVGKFVTVYPQREGEAVDLARELHEATRGLTGPKIPFDVPYRKNSLVFYRYGSFSQAFRKSTRGVIIDPAGRTHRDVRDRVHAVPKWLSDPFQQRRRKRIFRIASPIGSDFLPFKALAQRGKGGVYEAVDLSVSPARLVIVKEGRRHGETDWLGHDGFARTQHEARVLRLLRQRGLPVPEVIREFSKCGNRYLILQKIPGCALLPQHRKQPRRHSWRRAMTLLNQLRQLLKAIHAAGYVWRDCKPDHIFISGGKIFLIDFEGACRISDTGVLPWGSHPYLPTIYRKQFGGRRPGTLEDDYALGVILFQFLSGKFPPTSARSRAAIYQRTRCPDHLRIEIQRLLKF